jgi:hypothetical protein
MPGDLLIVGIRTFGGPVVFQQGAMPTLVDLMFDFPVQLTREINGSFDMGLGNLPSLQMVLVRFKSGDASIPELEEAEACTEARD